MDKKYCQLHHYFYSEIECPFCLKERVKKFSVNKINKNNEITENDLNKLVEKFNKK